MGELPFLPGQASTVAGSVDLLFMTLIAISSFFTLIVLILIIYFGIKYRRGKVADRSNPPVTNLKVELTWVFGLLALSMGTFTWAAVLYFDIFEQKPEGMEIYVVGQQWMWKFQHPQGPREINELHVPVGEQIRLIMISQDVIHSFYVPAFRLKYDVLPGRYTYLNFEATKVGEYHIFCAEYCGTEHSGMIGQIIVMEPRAYQDWLSTGGGGETGATAAQPLAQSGEQQYQQLGCSGCHSEDANARAPSLVDLFGQTVPLQDGSTVIADESYLRESILFPQEKVVAGYDPIMPTYEGRISEEQLVELVEYIKSLSSEGNAASGSSDGAADSSGITPSP